jgi:uncharacterized protein (TIGR00369 family)
MSDMTERGREILAAQPFSRLVGAELVHFESGSVEMRLPITDALKQQNGFAHGGVVSYLADNALTFAGGSKFAGPVVTAEMKINYVRPAVGEVLIARAQAISSGATQAVARCDVFVLTAEGEKLCAAAQGTIMALPKRDG